MSMQMAKRVSLSRPWGLNRSPHEIESLGTSLLPVMSWPDVPIKMIWRTQPASGQWMRATCSPRSTSVAWFQRSTCSCSHLSYGRTHPKGNRTHCHYIRSSKGPSTQRYNQTHRQVDLTRAQAKFGHFQRASRVAFLWPDASAQPWPNAAQRPVLLSLRAKFKSPMSEYVSNDRTQAPCVWSSSSSNIQSARPRPRHCSPLTRGTGQACSPAFGQLQWAPRFHQLCHPWLNMPTTKCITFVHMC
jgi:hypothetical protein